MKTFPQILDDYFDGIYDRLGYIEKQVKEIKSYTDSINTNQKVSVKEAADEASLQALVWI